MPSEKVSQFRVNRLPVNTLGVGARPIEMPVDILLGLPSYITAQPFLLQEAFNLPGALSILLQNHPEAAPRIVRPHIWAPGLDDKALRSFAQKTLLVATAKPLYKPASLRTKEFPGEDLNLTKRGKPKNYEIIHFYGRLAQDFNSPALDIHRDAPQSEVFENALKRADTRLLIIDLLDRDDLSIGRLLSERLSSRLGMAILTVWAETARAREAYFMDLYANILHNRQLVKTVMPSPHIETQLAVELTFPEEAEDLLSFNRWMDELGEKLSQQEVRASRIRSLQETVALSSRSLHQGQLRRLTGGMPGQRIRNSISGVQSSQRLLSSVLSSQPWDHESDGAVFLPEIQKSVREFERVVRMIERSASQPQAIQQELKNAPRVLNANFADPSDTTRTLPLDASLGAGREYDFRMDIGPLWDKNPSLFKDEKLAAFPDEVILLKLLAPEERERGAFDVQVVFVSEEFTPKLVTAMISVPVLPTGRSIPYIDGQLAEQAGWVSLRVRAPQLNNARSEEIMIAHGRLCLYYRNNLLQSGAVGVGIGKEPGSKLNKRNTGVIDFVLTGGFQQVQENLDQPISISEGIEQSISINLTLNDDGSGGHRIVALSQLDTNTPHDLPAAWMPYNLQEAKDLLVEARQTLLSIIKPMQDNPAKDRKAFIDDLQKLSILGSRVRNKFLMSGLNVEEKKNGSPINPDEPGITPAQWTAKLFQKLASASVIQMARTGPASYVFPWALLYEYPMEGPGYKTCDVLLDEWGKAGCRSKLPDISCPHKDKDWHHSNVVCPYGFWGLKHVIEQPASGLHHQNDQWRLTASNKILTSGGFTLAIAATDDVDQKSLNTHLDNLKKLKSAHFEASKPACDQTSLKTVLRAPQIIYFLCHGEWDPKDPNQREKAKPYLSIGPHDEKLEHKIYPTTLINWSIDATLDVDTWAKRRPLVFINGCETANINPEREANFVTAFDYLGASGVIGTEISMLVDKAFTVAEAIMSRLAEGKQVGQAVREMRWQLLNEGNVIGLAYTPYCRAILHIESET